MKDIKAVYNERRGKWRLNYTNPPGEQVQAMYDKDGVLIEFDDKIDANLWIFNYYADRTRSQTMYEIRIDMESCSLLLLIISLAGLIAIAIIYGIVYLVLPI